jgi:hypothetical protein
MSHCLQIELYRFRREASGIPEEIRIASGIIQDALNGPGPLHRQIDVRVIKSTLSEVLDRYAFGGFHGSGSFFVSMYRLMTAFVNVSLK